MPLCHELLVEDTELTEEAVVWTDLSFMSHGGQRRVDVQVLPQHQVSDHQGGGAAVALSTVDIHLSFPTFKGQCFSDEVSGLLEEHADVVVVGVVGGDAMVDDARAAVELCVCVDVHEGVPLGRIQDVSDAQAFQTQHVTGHKRVPHEDPRVDFVAVLGGPAVQTAVIC